MDKRLEEQLERVKKLSERVAQIHEQIAQNAELLNRERPKGASPLHEVRDFRTWQHEHGVARDQGRHERRAEADARPGRRRRG